MKKLLASMMVLLLLCGCKAKQQARSSYHLSISDIKTLAKKSGNASLAGALKLKDNDSITVSGYLVIDNIVMLVTDLKYYQANAMMPDSTYLVLGGDAVQQIKDNPKKYFGSRVQISTRASNLMRYKDLRQVQMGPNLSKFNSNEPILICPNVPNITLYPKNGLIIPGVWNLCRLAPDLCKPGGQHFFSQRWALLYSGGIDPVNAHTRYWNDLKFMYVALRHSGFDADHIIVVYKDGTGDDGDISVNYAATKLGVTQSFADLKGKMNSNDLFFMFVTNHGGGYDSTHIYGDPHLAGGRIDVQPDEIDDGYVLANKYDETIYYYNESERELWDDTLSTMINSLSFNKMIGMFEPCFSGGLLYDLRGANRILISAADEFEYSWAGAPGDHDMFSYYFTAALNKAEYDGTAVNADANHDGHVSLLEAFNYAKSHDTESEHPLLEDTGDGKGTPSPSATSGDGVSSAATRLN